MGFRQLKSFRLTSGQVFMPPLAAYTSKYNSLTRNFFFFLIMLQAEKNGNVRIQLQMFKDN